MRRSKVLITAVCGLGGCFAELTTAYVPTMKTQVDVPAMSYAHDEGAMVVAVHIGFAADFYGVGIAYSGKSVGGTSVHGVSGLPDDYDGAGWRLRGDVSVPVRFGPKHLLGLRATAAYQRLEKFNLSPSSDGFLVEVPGAGSNLLLGVTAAIPTNDVMLTVGILRSSMQSEASGGWPALSTEGTGLAMSLHVRFVPPASIGRYAIWPQNRPVCTRVIETCTHYGRLGMNCISECG